MSTLLETQARPRQASPLGQLMLARLREFWRQPEAIFWTYGFPLLMTVALGIAFRNRPVDKYVVDVQDGPQAEKVAAILKQNPRFDVEIHDEATSHLRLRTDRTELVVVPKDSAQPVYDYRFVPSRSESQLARNEADDTLQRGAGRKDPAATASIPVDEPGGRYIDFLVPGLLGMSLMGGGLWGVGFVTVDMRIRKLLKRFLATPMKRGHFLGAIMLSRLVFIIPELLILLGFAYLAFGVRIVGSPLAVLALILIGAFTFAGIGLLVASRARTMEAVSGLMNLVMLPMWILSGIFFSSDRFPQAAQPFIQALPLTPLNHAVRAVMLEGTPLAALLPQIAILLAWGVGTFVLALWWFRWN
ncbi:MAG TPA: ABC transporter permease [Gemmataceae bacterium]|nr:ABC transporter permease [Gemmataceae bacterium]